MGCLWSGGSWVTAAAAVQDEEPCAITVRQLRAFNEAMSEEFLAYCCDHALLPPAHHVCRRAPCNWQHNGVQHCQWVRLGARVRGQVQLLVPDMRALSMRYLRTWSQVEKCSIARLLNPGRRIVPEFFVSHCWSEPFEDLVRSLHMAVPPHAGIWLSGFCLNWSENMDARVTAKALEASEHFILVMDAKVEVLTRLWCVYELHMACRLNKNLGVVAAATSAELRQHVADRVGGFKLSKCWASDREDYVTIWNAINGSEVELEDNVRAVLGGGLETAVFHPIAEPSAAAAAQSANDQGPEDEDDHDTAQYSGGPRYMVEVGVRSVWDTRPQALWTIVE